MLSRQLPMSSTGSNLFDDIFKLIYAEPTHPFWAPNPFTSDSSLFSMLKPESIERSMKEIRERLDNMYTKPEDFPKTVTVNGHGTVSSYNLPGVKVAQQIEHANAGVNRDLCPNKKRVAVYALIKVIEPEKDLTDWDPKDKKYYWTNAEGVRRPVKDLDTEHLKGILEMPDFKNSRLTAEMRHAIREELYRRNIQTARYKV